jgi:hypothetical protein
MSTVPVWVVILAVLIPFAVVALVKFFSSKMRKQEEKKEAEAFGKELVEEFVGRIQSVLPQALPRTKVSVKVHEGTRKGFFSKYSFHINLTIYLGNPKDDLSAIEPLAAEFGREFLSKGKGLNYQVHISFKPKLAKNEEVHDNF